MSFTVIYLQYLKTYAQSDQNTESLSIGKITDISNLWNMIYNILSKSESAEKV